MYKDTHLFTVSCSGSQSVISGFLGILKVFSKRPRGQSYFHNNTKTLLASFILIVS